MKHWFLFKEFVRNYKTTIAFGVFVLLILFLGISLLGRRIKNLKQENEKLSVELVHAQCGISIIRDTIRDTVPVSTVPVVVIKKSSYKSDVVDRSLLKDLHLSTGQIVSQQMTETEYSDTVPLHRTSYSTWRYADRWVNMTIGMKTPDTTLTYSVRDSVVAFVYREYKHRFLWWKWGTKGYKVKMANFNPHASIRYNQYIKVE